MKAKRIKIISGGQTGADRGALEAAFSLGIRTGGYCPKGYRTENGNDIALKKFGLIETSSHDYSVRTSKNIRISDGTVLFCKTDKKGKITGAGTKLTLKLSKKYKKPFIINPGPKTLSRWVRENKIKILNSAGSRESQYPGIYQKVRRVMRSFMQI